MFVNVASFPCAVSEFCIRPASEAIEFVGFYPPADSDVVEVGRPDPGVFFLAVVPSALTAIQMYLSPRVQNEDSTIATAVFFEQLSGLLESPIQAFLGT